MQMVLTTLAITQFIHKMQKIGIIGQLLKNTKTQLLSKIVKLPLQPYFLIANVLCFSDYNFKYLVNGC